MLADISKDQRGPGNDEGLTRRSGNIANTGVQVAQPDAPEIMKPASAGGTATVTRTVSCAPEKEMATIRA